MSLPPELISHVLAHLCDDPELIQALCLVSKAWAFWCQAHLFKSVHLSPPTLKGWLENIPQDAGGPASHTRTLTLEEYRLIHWINPQYPNFPLENLTCFSDVRSLSLIQWNTALFNGTSPERYFCHFGKSLRSLNLRFCTLDPVIFFSFLSLLPNVEDLEIAYPHPHPTAPDSIPSVPRITPSFCGTLSLVDINSVHLVLKALARMPLRFSTIRIRGSTFYEPEVYQMLLTKCQETLVSLRFEGSYRDRALPDVFLTSCNELEEVHVLLLHFMKLPKPLEGLLSSITSSKLRRISLTFICSVEQDDPNREVETDSDEEDSDSDEGGSHGRGSRTIPWELWDSILNRLAKQTYNVDRKLNLQLNIRRINPKPWQLDHLLPQFLEYGSLDINCN